MEISSNYRSIKQCENIPRLKSCCQDFRDLTVPDRFVALRQTIKNHGIVCRRCLIDLFQVNPSGLFHVIFLLFSVTSWFQNVIKKCLYYRNPVIYYTPAVALIQFLFVFLPVSRVVCLMNCSQQPVFCEISSLTFSSAALATLPGVKAPMPCAPKDLGDFQCAFKSSLSTKGLVFLFIFFFILYLIPLSPLCAIWLKLCMCIS